MAPGNINPKVGVSVALPSLPQGEFPRHDLADMGSLQDGRRTARCIHNGMRPLRVGSAALEGTPPLGQRTDDGR